MDLRPDIAMELRMTSVRKGQYDVEIVRAVQARRVLYDKAHEHHKNPRVKEVEWHKIGEELHVPANCVVKRWTVIRERFASEKRKVQQCVPSSWWLMNHMDWLDTHIQPRQRGKYNVDNQNTPSPPPGLPALPQLTHIRNLPNLAHISSMGKNHHSSLNSSTNSDLSIRYVDVGEPCQDDEADSRSSSPIMSIAYPEVLMKDISSEEEDNGSYNSMENGNRNHEPKDLNGREKLPHDNGRYSDYGKDVHTNGSTPNLKARRPTNGSDDSQQSPLALGLDLDEAAAARVMAALRGIDDPVLRHRFRQRAHQLAEECELIVLHTFHANKKRKEI